VQRRNLLQLLLGVLGAGLAGLAAFRSQKQHEPGADTQATLRAYVDALVPPDGDFPGAAAIGVVPRLLAAIPMGSDYRKLLDQGLAWLDAQARNAGGENFAALSMAARERIVASAEASTPGSLPRAFFQATRDDVLSHTYTDARSWNGLGYDGPPQPRGFPEYTQPPRAA